MQIAGVINISPTYNAHLFKRATGTSPHQYVIQKRVERAKLLLLKTDLMIADIALQVGFSSQSHLTQHFKRQTRKTAIVDGRILNRHGQLIGFDLDTIIDEANASLKTVRQSANWW